MNWDVSKCGDHIRVSIEELDDAWLNKKEATELVIQLKDMIEEMEKCIV